MESTILRKKSQEIARLYHTRFLVRKTVYAYILQHAKNYIEIFLEFYLTPFSPFGWNGQINSWPVNCNKQAAGSRACTFSTVTWIDSV